MLFDASCASILDLGIEQVVLCDANHDMNERKIESKQLRVMAKQKASDDISARPSKIIRQELLLHLPNYRTQEICKIIPTNLVLAASDLCPRIMFISVFIVITAA
jgi:hypothetical protein